MICYYYLTYKCQCRCEFCKIWPDGESHNIPASPMQTIEQNLDSMKRMGVRHIVFTGGEPLLREGLARILSLAKKNAFFVSLFTNGMLYPPMAKDLAGLIDNLYISLDAPDEDEHDRIRGQECFSEAINSLSAAKSLGAAAIINFTLTRESICYLPEMAELSQKYKARIRVNPVHHFHGLEGLEPVSIEYVLRYAKQRYMDINRAAMALLKAGGNNTARPVCRALESAITISPDDHLIAPCFYLQEARIPINGGLESIMKSDIVKGYKKLQGRLPACRGCMDIDYLAPSFSYKINKYWFLDLFSGFERKFKNMRKGI